MARSPVILWKYYIFITHYRTLIEYTMLYLHLYSLGVNCFKEIIQLLYFGKFETMVIFHVVHV